VPPLLFIVLILIPASVKDFVERYEAATHTKVWSDIRQVRLHSYFLVLLKPSIQNDSRLIEVSRFGVEQERRAELEKVGKMCDILEKELRLASIHGLPASAWLHCACSDLPNFFACRFMTVDDREQYTVPSLAALEQSLEAAMRKVRFETDRKIGGEMSYLENMVRLFACIYLHQCCWWYSTILLMVDVFVLCRICRSGENKRSATGCVTR
jgi:hypothetical protein